MLEEIPENEKLTNELCLLLGRCLTAWTITEIGLVLICANYLCVTNTEAAHLLAVFKSFSNKLTFIDVAVKNAVKRGDGLTYWVSIKEYIQELSGDRNFLAHTPVIINHEDGRIVSATVGPSAETMWTDTQKREPMSFLEVSELHKDFIYLSSLIMELSGTDLRSDALPSKFYTQVQRRRPPLGQRRASRISTQ